MAEEVLVSGASGLLGSEMLDGRDRTWWQCSPGVREPIGAARRRAGEPAAP